MKRLAVFFIFLLLFFLLPRPLAAGQKTCVVYFTGKGCSHCAKVDPVLLEELPKKYPNLVIVEYEIYQNKENAPLIYQYDEAYGSGLGIPLVVFGEENFLRGDASILEEMENKLGQSEGNLCPLVGGSSVSFEDLDISTLPGEPTVLPNSNGEVSAEMVVQAELTLPKIVSLAVVDAINPCALAVLVMMLFAILALAPKRRSNLLLAGLAFTTAVFLMYFFYGFLIVRFFQLIQALANVRPWLYKILGLAAIIFGVLNIRDFIRYKPGGFLTEMPMFLRPKVQKLMFKVTSPQGAFVVGLLVTLFLLPCTIGPYVICGGILCTFDLVETIPWLLLYNLIFVSPMLVITLICYVGFTTVEGVAGWKDKSIRYLHLVAGVIILGLGVLMLGGA